ncbi:MAG: tetratricopeptide repeat protein [Terriglobales bacterium]
MLLGGIAAQLRAQSPSTPVREIGGQIVDVSGSPLAAVTVELHSWNGGLLQTTLTGAGGRFHFEVRDQGPFELRISSFGTVESVPLESTDLADMEVRMPISSPGAAQPAASASAASTVSLNDLEATEKARSKLSAARKAMDKLDLSKAWMLVNEAIAAAPNWGKAYLMRGVLSMQNHDFTAAQHDLALAVEHNPKDTLALTELGKLYSTNGELPQADLYLRRALALSPVQWPTYFELANLDMKRKNYADAAAMAKQAILCDPPAPAAAHFLAAEAAEHLNDPQTAVQEYRSFLARATPSPEINPAIAAARQRLAVLDPHD